MDAGSFRGYGYDPSSYLKRIQGILMINNRQMNLMTILLDYYNFII